MPRYIQSKVIIDAPSPSSRRIVAASAKSSEHIARIVAPGHEASQTENEQAEATASAHTVNPLWMITAALAILFAVMAVLGLS